MARIDVVDGQVVVVIPAEESEMIARTIMAAGRVLSRDDPDWRFSESITALIGLLGDVGAITADVGGVVAESRRRVVESTRTTDEVVKETGLSGRRIRELAIAGELPGRQAKGGWIFHAETVAEFIDKRSYDTWAS